ncbi:MAG: c-type cytochrome [Helicobacteraceae bacterium]|nr:c-type cytochrome [Helicobacteraceae bacterium]
MKKLLLTVLAVAGVYAADGYEVFKNKCQQCHIESISKADVMKKFALMKADKEAGVKTHEKEYMKAPPMVEVSARLKENIIIKDDEEDVHRQVVIAFIKEYIDNPKLDYSMCEVMALEKFGVMPSQKGKLTNEEKQAVAEWIYDRYDGVSFK